MNKWVRWQLASQTDCWHLLFISGQTSQLSLPSKLTRQMSVLAAVEMQSTAFTDIWPFVFNGAWTLTATEPEMWLQFQTQPSLGRNNHNNWLCYTFTPPQFSFVLNTGSLIHHLLYRTHGYRDGTLHNNSNNKIIQDDTWTEIKPEKTLTMCDF